MVKFCIYFQNKLVHGMKFLKSTFWGVLLNICVLYLFFIHFLLLLKVLNYIFIEMTFPKVRIRKLFPSIIFKVMTIK